MTSRQRWRPSWAKSGVRMKRTAVSALPGGADDPGHRRPSVPCGRRRSPASGHAARAGARLTHAPALQTIPCLGGCANRHGQDLEIVPWSLAGTATVIVDRAVDAPGAGAPSHKSHPGAADRASRRFQRSIEEAVDLIVDLAAQPRDLALGDAGHAHGLHQVVDRAGRHPGRSFCLLEDRSQATSRPSSRRLLKSRDGSWASSALRDLQRHRAERGSPSFLLAVAVADGADPLRRALAMCRSSAQPLDLEVPSDARP